MTFSTPTRNKETFSGAFGREEILFPAELKTSKLGACEAVAPGALCVNSYFNLSLFHAHLYYFPVVV